ncbi:hypothetical protein V6M85_13145 [Sulfolobus tengchongensis]|uniref:Transcription regulator PadR N-terminal domain-containing protein n=1 Tax=Sulfolobus tengchongensis TaxID=207809 RepID=A0AAX4L1T0_9CREN
MFKGLESLRDTPKSILELQLETKISPSAFYGTVIPMLKELGLIDETYEPGRHNTVKRVIKITEKGRKLLKTLMEIWVIAEASQ